MRPAFHGFGLAVLMSVGAISCSAAGERDGYVGDYGDGAGYGFAGEAVGGGYIGAPFTRFPRPSELVPSAWSYGTYGVPTVTGIRQAPTAAPTLTVINGQASASQYRGMSARSHRIDRHLSRGSDVALSDQGGVRVISVTVPRR